MSEAELKRIMREVYGATDETMQTFIGHFNDRVEDVMRGPGIRVMGSSGQPAPAEYDGPASAIPETESEDAVDIANSQPDARSDSQFEIADWDGPDDPENPKNWSFKNKWAATAVVSYFNFISPVASSMMSPASGQMAAEFGITSSATTALLTSVLILAYAFGPLFLGPLSEIFGRSRVLQLASLWYLVWNLGCGFAQNKGQFIAFRFLAGLGCSAPLSIGGGVLGDTWRAEERGQAIAVYSLAPPLGPVFWSTSIVDGAIRGLGILFLRETFAPVLLERKAERIRRSMDPEKAHMHDVRIVFDSADRHWKQIFARALIRPFQLFFREPIIQLLGVYMAFVYGTLYLFLTTIPGMFQDIYGESVGIAGLNYFALGIGLSGMSQINARTLDKIYKYFQKRNGGVGRPEYRLPSMVPGTILLPIGLLITGWTATAKTFWIGPDIGIVLVGAGMILNFQCIQTYVIDAFTLHAASGLVAVTFLRSLAGFGFPLFAPAMYSALGYGKGDTILAAASIAIGCPAPILFWIYGERLRKASRYARKG